ncbi:MAG: DUF4330 family protein [Eubacteriales bacterium]|jgi:hypothetical protein
MAEVRKNKPRRRLGLLDVLIVLAVVVVVALAVLISGNRSEDAADGAAGNTITFQVEMQLVPEDFAQDIAVGDLVYDSKKGDYLGKVEQVEMVPYRALSYNRSEKAYKEAEVEGAWNAMVTVSAQAQPSSRSTMIGSVKVGVGEEMFLKSEHFTGSGYCVVMNLEGGEG